jgi:hypothetical protein
MDTGKLTDAAILAATIEPGKSARLLTEGHRLTLRITPDGKQWRLEWQASPGPSGECMTVLDACPVVSIEPARTAAAAVRARAEPRPHQPYATMPVARCLPVPRLPRLSLPRSVEVHPALLLIGSLKISNKSYS